MALLAPEVSDRLESEDFALAGPILEDGILVLDGPQSRIPEMLYGFLTGPANASPNAAATAIDDEFSEPGRTVSSRIISAVQAASRDHFDQNRKLLPRERTRLGLALIVWRGSASYVTVCGDARAYALREGQIYDLCPNSIGKATGHEDPDAPLIEPIALHEDDIIILAGKDLFDYVPEERVQAWFSQGLADGVDWLKNAVRDSVPLMVFRPGGRPDEPRQQGRFGFDRVTHTLNSFPLESVITSPGLRTSVELGASAIQSGVTGVMGLVRSFLPTTVVSPTDDQGEKTAPARKPSKAARSTISAPSLTKAVSSFLSPVEDDEEFEEKASRMIPSLSDAVARFMAPTDDTTDEIDKHEQPRRTGRHVKSTPRLTFAPLSMPAIQVPSRPFVVAAGLALSLALIASGAGISALASNSSNDVFAPAMAAAQQSFDGVKTSTDPLFTRQRLREAQFNVEKALAAKKDDAGALRLAKLINDKMLKLDKPVQIQAVSMVIDLNAAGAKSPTGLVVDGGNGYVLDTSGWGVRRVGLEPNKPAEPQIIAVKGTKSDENVASEPVAITWLAAAENRPNVGLLVMDADRDLFIQPGGKPFQSLTVRSNQVWQSFAGIRAYAGNLYVLDPKGNQVWRYTPNYLGFDTEMKGILEGASIEDARDFALDGDIYVVTNAVKIVKFKNGVGSEFDLRTLDKPISKPVGIVTGATAKNVYVGDAGSSRIVVFDKEGRFQRQIVSDTFTDLKAFTIDEAQKKLVYIAGGKLYRAALPD